MECRIGAFFKKCASVWLGVVGGFIGAYDTITAYKSAYGKAPSALPGRLADANLSNFQSEFLKLKGQYPNLTDQQIGDLAIRDISFGSNRINVGYGDLRTTLGNYVGGVPKRVDVNAFAD